MTTLSVQEIHQLAPDDASAKAAKGLVVPGKWPTLARDENGLWGECQGSGSKPYQVQVDFTGPAFRCTCPSRKFPCKHGLALMLLDAQHGQHFQTGSPPAWVEEWRESRRKRADQAAAKEKAAAEIAKGGAGEGNRAEAPSPRPATDGRREAARLARVGQGLADLERWLHDRLSQGLAALGDNPGEWQKLAVRMVDAQAPGLAPRLRALGDQVGISRADHLWPARVLGEMGRLGLLIEAFGRLESLPAPVQADVRTTLGFNLDKETVLAQGERLNDHWRVEGVAFSEEDRVWTRRVWLRGRRSGRYALLLDFSHGNRRFEQAWITGQGHPLTLAFYPGTHPLRALVADDQPALPPGEDASTGFPERTLADALAGAAEAWSANPWLWRVPLRVDDGIPVRDGDGFFLYLKDQANPDHANPQAWRGRLPLAIPEAEGWCLVAEAGGHPLGIAGEWDGETFHPLSAWSLPEGQTPCWTRESSLA